MSSRTKWWLGLVAAAVLAAPSAARGQQDCGPSAGLGAMPNYGPPVTEMPLPLMWGARDEGPFFSMEAVVMRINNILESQTVAQRGFWDDVGWIRGDRTGPTVLVLDGRNANSEIAQLLTDVGRPGQFVGSGAEALSTTSGGNNTKFTPGARMSIGYRLRNNISFEVSWLNLLATRTSASAGIIPTRSQNLGDDSANSFVSTPFFNYGPSFAGAERDVISDVLLTPIPPNFGTVSLVNPGSATGAQNEIITDDAFIDDLTRFRGTPVAAYGVGNGAELIVAKYRQEWNTGELNMRVPIFQGEVTRTYWTGGFRYAFLQERYRLLISDFDVDGTLFQMRYTNRVKNRYYGMQTGLGTEAYLGGGWAVSLDGKAGVLAERSEGTTDITNFFDARFSHSDNQFGVVGMFQGGAYLWWYPIEGIQLRAGYEYMGIVGARRSPMPVDYDLGRLRPVYERKYLSVDGFTAGVAFIF